MLRTSDECSFSLPVRCSLRMDQKTWRSIHLVACQELLGCQRSHPGLLLSHRVRHIKLAVRSSMDYRKQLVTAMIRRPPQTILLYELLAATTMYATLGRT